MSSVLQESPAGPRTHDAAAASAVERTIEASEALRAELLEGELAARVILEQLRSGTPLVETVPESDRSAGLVRDGAQRQLDAYLEARRRVRLALIDACLRSGLSRGQIAGILGVTRQRVTVLAKDLACGDRRTAGPSSPA